MSIGEVDAHIYVDNVKSIDLVKKFGFEFKGKIETCLFREREYLHHIYSLNF